MAAIVWVIGSALCYKAGNIQRGGGGGYSMGDRISVVLQSWARFLERWLRLTQDNAKF